MTDFTNWTHAMVTFHAGASYSVGGMKFVRNVPKRCPNLSTRKSLEGVPGFVIRDFFKEEANPAVKTVKKKKTVKKTVKQTEGDEE